MSVRSRLLVVFLWATVADCSQVEQAGTVAHPISSEVDMVLGLGTVIYHVQDLPRAKEWYTKAFGIAPYFDEPFYVGFNIRGYELGLDPDSTVTGPGAGGAVAYWRVKDVDEAVKWFVESGAVVRAPVQDVGGGVKVATLADPDGNLLGLIENPNFQLQDR